MIVALVERMLTDLAFAGVDDELVPILTTLPGLPSQADDVALALEVFVFFSEDVWSL